VTAGKAGHQAIVCSTGPSEFYKGLALAVSAPAIHYEWDALVPGHGLSMVEIEQNGAMTSATAFDGNPPLVVPRRFKRNAPQVLAMAPSADTGLWLLQYMAERIGIPDLAGLDILDFGCGSRFAEAITTHDIPLRSYIGIDVYKEMIEFLTQNVNDDRLSFHHLNARNPKYNRSGDPLMPETVLPIGDRRFDVICMFSVITHQLPHDAQAIFAILRRHVKESGFLFFSACLAEGDFGYREHDPERPTELSVFSKDLLCELLEREKWRVVSIEPGSPRDLPILDSILCVPA
jgi:SAM-dependent methyltransferase